MKRLLCAAAALAMPMLWMPAAHADTLQSFAAAGMAPVLQVTEDGANASFHPQGEGEVNYAQSILDASNTHAFATVFWPGSAAGNLGSLLAVTGQQLPADLNDPVRAEVDSGSGNPEAATTAPSGSTMSASIKPEQDGDRESRASTTSAGGALGPLGTVGAMSSSTKALLHDGTLSVVAQSSASGFDLPGTVHIDSVISTASVKSTAGGAPQKDGSTVVHGMTIAGQQVYVDANGVHTGQPGKPSDPAAVAAVNTALNAAGMQIYFTAAHDIVVGQVSYYYASSILFFFAPPGDTGKDSFSLSVGGAAVAMSASAGAGGDDASAVDAGATDDSSSSPSIDATPADAATPVLDLPTPTGAAATVTPEPVRRAAVAAAPTASFDAEPVAATERGVGGWPLAVLLAAIAGGVLLARLPALLATGAATRCPREQRPLGDDV